MQFEPSDIQTMDDLRIPVRDGITLSARVWIPALAAEAPMPAILEILPYRKRDGTAPRDATSHAVMCRHGYVCLRVDLRGCGESDGLFDDEYSEQELSDIEDVIGWIAAQGWCCGAVGIMGISWGGFNGLQVAARRPEALKAVISICSGVDRYHDDIHYKGGCELTENAGWAATATSWFSMPPDPALVGESWRATWLDRLENTPFLMEDWAAHAARDAYWQRASVCEDFAAIQAPVLSISGWHDGYRNTFAKLLEGGTSGPVKAIVGPWNHKYPHMAAPEPRMDFLSEALAWWDHWLKGKDNGVEALPDCRLYVMDGIAPKTSYVARPGRWVALPRWPAPQITTHDLVLGNHVLGDTPMSGVVSIGTNAACGQGFGEFFPFGFGPGEMPDDQRGDDALSACFDGAPLEDAMQIVGAPRFRCSLTSDQRYGQMVARLCDVAPDGASTLISLGILNLTFRDGFDVSVPLTPGETYEVGLDLDHTAYVVPKGHRLRLAISTSYWPFIWPEAGDVNLSFYGGQLRVPQLGDTTGLDWACPAPGAAAAATTRVLRDGTESKELHRENGELRLVIAADHGEIEHLAHGWRTTSAIREVWSIDAADVGKARAQISWDRSVARDDFAASTRVETVMHSDRAAHHVTMRLHACEGEQTVFERTWHSSVPRQTPSLS